MSHAADQPADWRDYLQPEAMELAELLGLSPGMANRQLSLGVEHVRDVIASARAFRSSLSEAEFEAMPDEYLLRIFDLRVMPDGSVGRRAAR